MRADLKTPVLLGHDTTTREPIYLPYASRTQGLLIIGGTGTGKSSAIKNLVQQDFKNGTASIVLDPHGELVEHLLEYAAYYDVPNVYVLEVDPAYTFGLNLYKPDRTGDELEASRRTDTIMQVFKKQWENVSWGPNIEYALRNTSRSLMYLPVPTMLDVPRLFYDPDFRKYALSKVTDLQVKFFWQEYEAIPFKEQVTFRRSTLNKISEFLDNPTAKYIVGQTNTTVDFQALLDENATLLISLPISKLGEGVVELIGSLLITQLTTVIYSRDRALINRLHLYIDEYGRFCTGWTTNLLKEGRKFNVGTTIAHQTRADLRDEASKEAELQTGSLISFRLTGDDAETLSMKFTFKPEIEVIGEKQILTLHPKPFTYMLEHNHENTEVRQLLAGYFKPLELIFGDWLNRWLLALKEQKTSPGSQEDIASLVEECGSFFYKDVFRKVRVTGAENIWNELAEVYELNINEEPYSKATENLSYLLERLVLFREQPFSESLTYWLKILEQVMTGAKLDSKDYTVLFAYVQSQIVTQTQVQITDIEQVEKPFTRQREYVHFDYKYWDSTEPIKPQYGNPKADIDPYFIFLQEESWKRKYQEWERDRFMAELRSGSYTPPLALIAHRYKWEIKEPTKDEIREVVQRLLTDMLAIFRLGFLIQAYPVKISSGQTEAMTRPRPLADIRLEQANRLATFPNFEAMVQLQVDGEFQQAHIRTIAPEQPQDDPEVLEYIRNRSRERFGKQVEQVKQEIAARQAKHSKPSERKQRILQEENEK